MQSLRGTLKENVSLAGYTSWRVGGQAKHLYEPADLQDLISFLKQLPETEPLLWLGLGSNTLVRDGGFQGTVIVTQGVLNQLEQLDTQTIRTEAGVSCAKVARYCARQGLVGMEFLAGIPGTMGGALRMNAGCYNGETWNFVTAVECVDRYGTLTLRKPEEYHIAYRHVETPAEEWFVAGHFHLPKGDGAQSLATIKELLSRRAATQPTGDYSCGSVFRNPPGDYAARLIESCGLKGLRIGDAKVSEKHANFIINTGQAKAVDIEALIKKVAETVFERYGVKLIREVHIVGD